MKSSYFKENAIAFIFVCMAALTACLAFAFLPEKIPMQWNGTSVIWYADRIAIFCAPVISTIVVIFLKPLIDSFFKNYLSFYPKLSGIIVSGIAFILYSCELYTIAFCFGIVLHIEYIIFIELLFLAILCFLYILKTRKNLQKQ